MQTVLEVLRKTTVFFEEMGVNDAQLNAELLIASELACKRLDLYLRFDEPLSELQLQALRPLVKRRSLGEPLQYILGEVEFFGLKLRVDSRALIPRPETEAMVATLVELWGEDPPRQLLDLGTGSGAIALAFANKYPQMKITAIDRSTEALALAQKNGKFCGLLKNVTFLESDWFEAVEGRFDFIIANPPYLSAEEWSCAQKEVKDFEPKEALTTSREGLKDLKTILKAATAHLTTGGSIALETGIEQHAVLYSFAQSLAYTQTDSWKDLNGRERYFIAKI